MYVVIWEFRAKPGFEKEFEQAYGPEGEWAQFFTRGDGFIKTDLLHDFEHSGRYLTLDYWRSQAEFEAFREQRRDEYETIDRRCVAFTEHEARVGSFDYNKEV
jgi:heme-degrading monooxygenase HmoA